MALPAPPDFLPPRPAGVALGLTVASLAATTALLVYVRRQRAQLAVLQRKRSAASFSSFQLNPSFSMGAGGPAGAAPAGSHAGAVGKQATLHTFAASGQARQHPKLAKALSIIPTWSEGEEIGGGYIQVH